MGTDFSIKAVGASPVVASAQPASEAPKDAVATVLPPSKNVAAMNAVARLRNDPQPTPDSTSHQVVLDRAANLMVYQVVDNRTSLVVRQFPDEAMLRRRAYFHALDLINSDPLREHTADRMA